MKDVFGLVQRLARQLVRKKPHYCALVNSHGDGIDMGTMYRGIRQMVRFVSS